MKKSLKDLFSLMLCVLLIVASLTGVSVISKSTAVAATESSSSEYEDDETYSEFYTGEDEDVSEIVTEDITEIIEPSTEMPEVQTTSAPEPGIPMDGGGATDGPTATDGGPIVEYFEEGIYTYYVVDGEAYASCDSEDVSGSLTVPSTLGGYPVVSIDGFCYLKELTSVVIPDGVRTVTAAFNNCPMLSDIALPDSVERIWWAFEGTAYGNNEENWKDGILYIGNHIIDAKEDIEGDIVIPEGVCSISDVAFEDCTKITSVVIPEGIKFLYTDSFYGCDNLSKIELPDSLIKLLGDFSGTAFYNDPSNWEDGMLYCGNNLVTNNENDSGEYVIKDGTRLIGTSVNFDNAKKVDIPDSVEVISGNLFYEYNELESIKLPENLKYVGCYTFFWCSSLKEIVFPEKTEYIDEIVVNCCTSLEKVTILNPYTKIYGLSDTFGGGDVTVCGYSNSTAEAYAEMFGLKFESLGEYKEPGIEIGETDTVKLVGEDSVLAAQQLALSDIITLGEKNVTVTDKDGKEVTADTVLKSGMTVTLKDGSGNVIQQITVIVPGDNDGDGNVSSADARTALRAAVELEKINSWQTVASDMDNFGKNEITSADARFILRYSVGLEDINVWMKTVK